MIWWAFGIPFIDIPGDILGGIGGIVGIGFGLWRARQMKRLIKEVLEAVQAYRKANEDGKITPEEATKIIEELADVASAGVDVWKFTKSARKV